MNNLPPNLNNKQVNEVQRLQNTEVKKDLADEKPAEFEYKEGSSLNLNPASVIGQSMVQSYKKESREIFEEFEKTKQFLLQQNCTFLNKQTLNAPFFNKFPERADRLNKFVNLAKNFNIDLIKNANLGYFTKEEKFDFLMNYISLNQETTSSELNKEIAEFSQQQERKAIYETETKNIENPLIRDIAADAVLKLKRNVDEFEDIDAIMHNIDDPIVLNYVNDLFSEIKNAMDKSDVYYSYSKILEKIDNCLDVYHTMNSNYEYVGDSSDKNSYPNKRKYTDFVKKNPESDKYIHSQLENADKEAYSARNDYSLYDSANEGRWKDFLNEGNLERLKDFCEFFPDDKMSDYFYTEYYLKNQNIPEVFAEKLDKINKEFNTKVFLSHVNIEKAAQELDFVYDELSQWKKHSNGQAKYPSVLDLSKIKQNYIDNTSAYGQNTSAGYAKSKTRYIAISGYENIRYALRHELMHENDTKQGRNINPQYNLSEIMPKISKNGTTVPDFENCKYQNEFLRAGISKEHINYAYNNVLEFIAVAAEGDMSKYSPWFKDMLVDFGMPEWAFNLEVLDAEKIQRAEEIDNILKMNKEADIGVPFENMQAEINKFNSIKNALKRCPDSNRTAESIYKETLDIYNDVYDMIPEELDGDSIAERVVRKIILDNKKELVYDNLDKKELYKDVKTLLDEGLKTEKQENLNGKYFAYNLELLEEFKESNKDCIQKYPEMNLQYNPKLIYRTYKSISNELKNIGKPWIEDKIFCDPNDLIPLLNGTFDMQEYINKLTKN